MLFVHCSSARNVRFPGYCSIFDAVSLGSPHILKLDIQSYLGNGFLKARLVCSRVATIGGCWRGDSKGRSPESSDSLKTPRGVILVK